MSKKMPVQKGPIVLNQPTMKTMTYKERAAQDHHNDVMRKDMITSVMMTCKQQFKDEYPTGLKTLMIGESPFFK